MSNAVAYRTHTCGDLWKSDDNKTVRLAGWVDTIKVMKNFGFANLRDRYGITQVFFDNTFLEQLQKVKREAVVSVEGVVKVKPQPNPKLATGEIEIAATKLDILNTSEPLPLELDESVESTEETRMKYRYIDLRKPRMQNNLMLRHKVTLAARKFFDENSFIEVETPILYKSTPEGAKEYLVPSRVNAGKCYALPQSPQVFKQLLMIAGYDRYFQIARCFRDEDLRADRQPEFTQIDVEMSFIKMDDILSIMERLVQRMFKEALNVDVKIPFERHNYDDVMKKYNSDKPDLRQPGEQFHFAWVINFPMFEYREEDKKWYAAHHPFTMPQSTDFSDMGKVRAYAYDLVLNGYEIGGGSIRIFDYDTQMKLFKAIGLTEEDAQKKFGFLLDAMKYGNPPIGGIALGLDRLSMIMAGEQSLREVIAFPKNKDAQDLMTGAPTEPTKEQMDLLHIKPK